MPCGIYRTFLDTNIVWYADWLAGHIFDYKDDVLRSPKFTRARQRQKEEWLALSEIFRWALHVNPVLVVSETVVAELRQDRRSFGWELHEWIQQNEEFWSDVSANDADYRMLSALPDHELIGFVPGKNDRRLLAEALFYGCDSFLTMDERTIWQYRDRIEHRIGVRVLRPSEMFDSVFAKSLIRAETSGFLAIRSTASCTERKRY